jgi:Methyltransferase domain
MRRVRAALPPPVRSLAGRCLHFLTTLPLRWRGAERVFTAIYRDNAWRGDESGSGPGSSLAATAELRQTLPRLIADLHCVSLLDAPCGDLWWLKEMTLPVATYYGVDIVKSVVAANQRHHAAPGRTFLHLDLRRTPLPRADLILCRDCLVHFSYQDIFATLANFRASGATWLLTTTFPAQPANRDVVTGEWRPLNLHRPPFNLPPPATLLAERCPENAGTYQDKSLGLWRLTDLPTPAP